MNHANLSNGIRIACLALMAILNGHAAASESQDFKGSQDHPDIPRVSGTRIGGYDYADYDAGRFVTGVVAKTPEVAMPEGKRTRIIYFGTESQSSLQMFRNYERAFARMGTFTKIYSCQRDACMEDKVGSDVVWPTDNRIPNEMSNTMGYGYDWMIDDPMYLHGTVQIGERLLHVSVFTVWGKGNQAGPGYQRPIVHLEVLEVEDFEPSLASVEASDLTDQLATQGHVAVYGISFDFDSATLQSSSAPVISEVAKSLAADPALSVFVVGHTDNEGQLDYNQSLSQQRAAAVVTTLINDYGIDAGRLTPVGVRPVAPKASNADESGRAVNRRVEIVRR